MSWRSILQSAGLNRGTVFTEGVGSEREIVTAKEGIARATRARGRMIIAVEGD